MVSTIDPTHYVNVQTQAVAIADGVAASIAARVADQTAANIFLVGSGGAGILAEPAVRLLREHSTFPVHHDKTAELLAGDTVHLNDRSIVVLLSLSGTTGESLELAQRARDKGATVITLTGDQSSPLAEFADETHTVGAADPTSSESFYLQTLLIALAILEVRDEFDGAREAINELRQLPKLLQDAKDQFEDRAAEVAGALDATDYHIITSAGTTWPAAWYYGMCILEEMQWIRTRPVHASDYFHGTLELVQRGVSVIVMKGEDAGREMAERVERFTPRVTDAMTVIDTATIDLPGISDRVRALASPVVLAALLERVSAHVEQVRRHPLETRRYYRRLDY